MRCPKCGKTIVNSKSHKCLKNSRGMMSISRPDDHEEDSILDDDSYDGDFCDSDSSDDD